MIEVCVGPLIRATTAHSAVIWLELSAATEVIVRATLEGSGAGTREVIVQRQHSVKVADHHYVALHLTGLREASWYHYEVSVPQGELVFPYAKPTLQCVRTLTASTQPDSLRLLFGSCRRLDMPEEDTMVALGSWLNERAEQREELWPHLLLLLGDQIYADEPPPALLEHHPHLREGIATFDDFSQFYRYAWTNDARVRQVLAVLPTFMMFDDHEIHNNWNISPTWRMSMLKQKGEAALLNGLIAYWIYQGWGNVQADTAGHPLLDIMQEAAQTGEDAYNALSLQLSASLSGKKELGWHYIISTRPSIFVSDTRAARTMITAEQEREKLYAPTQIMGDRQLEDLQNWLTESSSHSGLLASSVPVLLPPVIGLVEYYAGIRPLHHAIAPLRWLGRQVARLQIAFALKTSFDHWPIFSSTWRALLQAFSRRGRDLLVLSGDVHFSYMVEGSRSASERIIQIVSTPIQNRLSQKDQQKISLQSYIKRMRYGGVRTRIMPLQKQGDAAWQIKNHLIYDNVLALITMQPRGEQSYHVQQEYLGMSNDTLQVMASATFECRLF